VTVVAVTKYKLKP